MTDVFVTLLNISITASWLVLAVVTVRLVFKKAPKKIICLLWALVALRLILPFSIESTLSLIPSRQTVNTRDVMETPDTWQTPEYVIDSGFEIVDDAVNPIVNRVHEYDTAKASHRHVDRMRTLLSVLSVIWMCGVALMLVYSAVSYLRLKRRVAEAVPIENGVMRGGSVKSPFILGVFRPKIYIPDGMQGETLDYALIHERAHIKRGDHLIKPFAFLLLSVYWFNPLMWLAYVLLCRDIEAACDERVLKGMDETERKVYASALLDCAADRKGIAVCPVAFGETNVKQRIKGALSYKKPALWIIIAAVAVGAVLAAVFLTDPVRKNDEKKSYAELEGVSLSIVDAKTADGAVTLTLKWDNNSKDEIRYGEPFDVVKKNIKGEWKSCAKEELAFTLPAYPLESGKKATITRDLSAFDLSEPCEYRFTTDFDSRSYGDHFDIKHTAWVAFTVLPDGSITYEKTEASTPPEDVPDDIDNTEKQYFSKTINREEDKTGVEDFLSKIGFSGADQCHNVTPAALTAAGMNVQIFELGTYGTPYIMIDGEVYPLYLYASDTFISAAPCDIDGDGNLDILLTYDPLTDSIQAGIAVFNTVSKTIERIFLDGYNDCLFICSASSSGGVQTFEIEAYLDYGPQLVTVYTVVTEDGKEPMILNNDNSNAKGAFYSINETYAESGAMALYREKILQRIAGRSEGKGELIDGGYYDDTDLQIEYDTYFLYDIDSDFVPEFIITNSAAETAKTSFIFTVKNGELIRLGAVGASHTTWHSLNGENKLFKSEGHMGASFAQTVEIRDGSLRMGEILYDLRDRDYGAYVDEYCDIPPIYEYRCRDLSGLHWNGDPYGVSRSEIAEGVKGVLNNAP